MAETFMRQDRLALWIQKNPGEPLELLGVDDNAAGLTGINIPVVDNSPVYSKDRNGKPVIISVTKSAPGDLPGLTVTIYDKPTLTFLLELVKRGCPVQLHRVYVDCGVLDNPNIYTTDDIHVNSEITSYSPGDGPTLVFSGELVTAAGTMTFEKAIRFLRTGLSALTNASEALNDIAGLKDEDCNECGNGYAGPDKIMYAAADAAGGATAKLRYTADGGSTWADTSADPFAADENIDFVQVLPISQDEFRVVVATGTTDGAATAKFAYADVEYGDEGTTVWTTVNISAGANGDVIEALLWAEFSRGYVASAGDIFLSDDGFNSDPGTAIYTGATAMAGFAKSFNGRDIWAYGASNLILRERDKSGVFEAKVGPSGGGAFTAVAQADDNLLYAGNGQALYKSVNQATNAGGWEALKDFGASHSVAEIQLVQGNSQVFRVVVDDATPGNGEVWETRDGGATFTKVTELTNTGYNAAYFSEIDDNLGVVVGDGGSIHLLQPVA